MDGRKSKGKSTKNKVDTIYMDLKEILREQALRYLPAKTLLRSRTVCRDWKLQISTPFFVHNQSLSFRSVSGVFFQSPNGSPSFLSFDPLAYGVPDPELKFLPEPVDVKSSSNGLLCCQGRSAEKAYYVCNPVTRQWKKLPKSTSDHGPFGAPVIVFEPSLMNFMAEYKVVCIFPSPDLDEAYEFDMYSSAQDSWKVCNEMLFTKTRLSLKTGMTVNNVCYWPTNEGTILSFDLKTQKAEKAHGSYYGYYGGGYRHGGSTQQTCLGQVNGWLCRSTFTGLSLTVSVIQPTFANTMPMKQNTRPPPQGAKHQVQLKSADGELDASSPPPHVLLTWDDMVLFHSGSKMFIYNLKSSTTTALGINASLKSGCAVFPYVNSLVSLV